MVACLLATYLGCHLADILIDLDFLMVRKGWSTWSVCERVIFVGFAHVSIATGGLEMTI